MFQCPLILSQFTLAYLKLPWFISVYLDLSQTTLTYINLSWPIWNYLDLSQFTSTYLSYNWVTVVFLLLQEAFSILYNIYLIHVCIYICCQENSSIFKSNFSSNGVRNDYIAHVLSLHLLHLCGHQCQPAIQSSPHWFRSAVSSVGSNFLKRYQKIKITKKFIKKTKFWQSS